MSIPWPELVGALTRSSAVRHGRHRAYSGEPPSQPSTPIDVGRQGEAVDGDLTASDLAGDEQWPVNHCALLYVTDTWGQIDSGSRCQPLGTLESGVSSILV